MDFQKINNFELRFKKKDIDVFKLFVDFWA